MARWLRPRDAAEARRWFAREAGGASPVAYVGGGTALQLDWPAAETAGGLGGAAPATTLIDVGALPEAAGTAVRVRDDGRWLRIGAACRLEALRRDALVAAHAPLLRDALQTLAALSVRHLATLGGNLGWRWGDCAPALLALDARVERDVDVLLPLAEWFADDPLPLITAIWIPLEAARGGVFEKVGLRAAFSPTRLALAVTWRIDAHGAWRSIRVAAGAARWPARRLRAVEGWLDGRTPRSLRDDGAGLRQACADDLCEPSAAAATVETMPVEAAAAAAALARARLTLRLLRGHLGGDADGHRRGRVDEPPANPSSAADRTEAADA